MKTAELEKSSMAFKLESGDILLISKDDVTEIANKLIFEMMITKQNVVYMLNNPNVEKSNMLYKMVVEQKEKMSEKMLTDYMKVILELLKTDESELSTLKEKMEKEKRS